MSIEISCHNSDAMKRIHLVFGLLVLVIFLITGQFMRRDFPDKDAIDQTFRLLMRSRHIYILFSSLIHLALGMYLHLRPQRIQRILQLAGSLVLFGASVLLVWAFVVETYELAHYSNLSRWGIYLSLAGVGLHLLGGISPRER